MDATLLNEIATNSRTISHPEYGTYVICRSTYSIEAQIESVRTRQMNSDLQARVSIEDPITGEATAVPAYLTRAAKAEQLRFHGIWTEKQEAELQAAIDEWMKVTQPLDEMGFEGSQALEDALEDLRKRLSVKLGDKFADELLVLVPVLDTALAYQATDEALATYRTARLAVKKGMKSVGVDELLDEADKLHKQYSLFAAGIQAQLHMVGLRVVEIQLFDDTIEGRADNVENLAKIFYSTTDPDTGKCPWSSFVALSQEATTKIKWLVGEIRRFESLEDASRPVDRFNFLGGLRATADVLFGGSP
jgi:hypothetical protein